MDVDALAKTKGGKKGGTGTDKGSKSEKFNCDWCGMYGHKQKDCWAKAAGKPKSTQVPTRDRSETKGQRRTKQRREGSIIP